jgi:hypothetical protein
MLRIDTSAIYPHTVPVDLRYVCMYVCVYVPHVCMYVCMHELVTLAFFSKVGPPTGLGIWDANSWGQYIGGTSKKRGKDKVCRYVCMYVCMYKDARNQQNMRRKYSMY